MQGKISCSELLKYIPDELLTALEQKTRVNVQVKKLSGKTIFKLFLFALLDSERLSLRVMEELYNSEQFRIYAGHNDQRTIRHSGIADRLVHVKADFFEQIFQHLLQKLKHLLPPKDPYQLVKFDSTLVAISAKLMDIGMRGGAKNSAQHRRIKYTFSLKDHLPTAVKIFSHQSKMSEEVALREVILAHQYGAGEIMVFDRGLQRRKSFGEFQEKGIDFITRLKSRLRYRTVRVFREAQGRKTNSLILEQDIIVQLKDENDTFTQSFRLITGKSLLTGEPLQFVTNILYLNAREITDCYKQRWEIETFFRFLKQELNFSHLIARNENGITVMLYMTLITALLLLAYKRKNHIPGYKIAKLRFVLELEMDLLRSFATTHPDHISRLLQSNIRLPPY